MTNVGAVRSPRHAILAPAVPRPPGPAGGRGLALAPPLTIAQNLRRGYWGVSGARMIRRLGVNVDHVATLRQARQARYPDPLAAALIAERAGAAQITVCLLYTSPSPRD